MERELSREIRDCIQENKITNIQMKRISKVLDDCIEEREFTRTEIPSLEREIVQLQKDLVKKDNMLNKSKAETLRLKKRLEIRARKKN